MNEYADSKRMSIAILTVSDSRDASTDTSGAFLKDALQQAGHRLAAHKIISDQKDEIRLQCVRWIDNPEIQVILSTGGTGFTRRDVTPEAIEPLLDKTMPGFGELFRMVSYQEIGTSSLQSRAFAGLAKGTWIFCLPGSTGACKTGWNKLISQQLDSATRPCNLTELADRI